MGSVVVRARRLFTVSALVVSVAFALLTPAIALAATTASFSSRTPTSGGTASSSRPTISVIGYDKYGARGSKAFAMTVDGKSVKPTATYIVTGSWNPNKGDYRRFKLSYRPSSNLKVGSHTAVVTVRDVKGKRSTTTWKFKVAGSTPVETTPTVTFTSMAPAPATSTSSTRPTISIKVYESFGVHGTGSYAMTLDGTRVTPSVSYAKSGDYRTFTLSYRAASAMSGGVHSVAVSLKDLKSKTSSTTWKFAVQAADPVYASMPSPNMASCSTCHTGYPAAHPMTSCQLCHGATAPPRPASSGIHPGGQMSSFTPADTSAHTLGCMLESPCHGGGGDFPHTLDTNCARCHTGTYAGIPAAHSSSLDAIHVSTSTTCIATGCHVASLTTEHYRRTVDGQRLSCETCHASTDPKVLAAISSHSTACTSCHAFASGTHPGTSSVHTSTSTCVGGACHATEVSMVHNGNCIACHAAGKFPSTTCTDCHAAGSYHAAASAKHIAPSGGCINTGCHVTDVTAIHGVAGGPGCQACHATGKTPSLDCTTCHAGDPHPNNTAKHAALAGTCVASGCHGTDVTTIHAAVGCSACHGPGKTPSTTCTTCHTGSVTTIHSAQSQKHQAATGTCVVSGCHATDISVIHANGPGCAACHASGKTPSADCTTCHPGDVSSLHQSALDKHTAPDSTCVTAGCHVTNVTTIHANGPGCAACHAAGKTPTLVCATCHPGDVTAQHSSADSSHAVPASSGCTGEGCHASNAATIHAAGPGCAACHGSGKTPTLACATCHAGDSKTIHTTAAGTKHTAPASGCVGDSCHAADVVSVHTAPGGPGCAACHGAGKTPSTDCTTCHVSDLVTIHASADTSHTAPAGTCVTGGCHVSNVAAIHGVAGGPGCAACHAPGRIPSTECGTCHLGDVLSLHTQIASAHTAPRGTCVSSTCHTDNVATIHANGPGCAACHAAGKTPSTDCSTCHAGTVDDLHAKGATPHMATTGTCVNGTCHDADVSYIHTHGTNPPGCVACHADGKTPSTDCTTCHAGDMATMHAPGDAAHNAPVGTCVGSACHAENVANLHSAGPGCAACHGRGVTPSLTCTDCHKTGLVEKHPTASSPHTAPAVTCVSTTCHSTNIAVIHTKDGVSHCEACHAAGVTPQSICSFCHVNDFNTLHAASVSPHSLPIGACVRTGCHAANVATTHTKDGVSHCEACHGASVTPSVACADCHANGTDMRLVHSNFTVAHTPPANACTVTSIDGVGCHTSSISSTHKAVPGSCNVCHTGAAGMPTNDCSTCHTTGFPATHPAPASKHTAPTGSCVISGCHSSDVTAIHGVTGGPGCAACHAAGKTPSLACTTCHTGDVGSKHTSAAATTGHVVTGTVDCVKSGCHGSNVTAIHVKNSVAHCEACHAVGKTPSTNCTTCHASGADHTAAHAECNGCHNGDHYGGPVVGSVGQYSMACTDCHGRGGSWTHPSTCHGCDGGGADGYTWTGIW